MSVKSSIYNIYSRASQASKSTSSKKTIRKRDISYSLPYSEFPATTGTFTGLVGKVVKCSAVSGVFVILGLLSTVNTYASSINITIPSGSTVLNTLNDGTFSESSVNASALVWTDNYTGYNLTIMGGNSTGVLEGTKGGTIPTIETEVTPTQFASDSELMNRWGFKPSKLYKSGTTIDNSNYIKSPTSDESVIIDDTKVANDENHKNTYTLALAAKVNGNTALDSYTQTFTLAATGNATEYHIAYADANNNMPGITYGVSDSGTAKISSTTPHKDGYIFGGWCTVSVVVGQDCAAAGGTVIPVSGDYTLDSTTANNTTLYAIWLPASFDRAFAAAGKSKVGAFYKMQDMEPSICNIVTTPTGSATNIDLTGAHAGDTSYVQRTTLLDERDGNTYLVSKLADGHCWMSQNLNLWLTADQSVVAYDTSTGQTFSYNPANTTQITADGTTKWNADASDGARSYGGDSDKYIGGTDIAVTGVPSSSGQPYERIGVYYNWAAATAQSGSEAVAIISRESSTSICPQGWRLPANSGNYSFSALMGSYGLPVTNQDQGYSKQLQNPLSFNRPGYYDIADVAIDNVGSDGHYWSSSADVDILVFTFSFQATYLYPHHSDRKGAGFPVRCVAV